ncbi:rhodanese-like domain-containing protein [Acidiferrobacter thiooxydans]|uniref:Sulfurtransferase n=1 Tax=Acidiferrobacter thiooxydans TaxID=163359 RepID=A0A368HFU3_9GAMM|nr:rhodanese-like domain-containing protein [Acidiferrobacter thiooxydans]RCN58262.1 sulfurtransferase [Acidiferrobacter thiooxydans]
MREIAVQDLHARLKAGETLVLLDVREPWERNLCALPNSLHAPMQQVPTAINSLNPEDEVIVYCHTGVRSFHVGKFLEHNGFKNVANLRGGIEAWAREVDKTMARY